MSSEPKWTKGPWHFDGGADWSIHDASGAVLAEVYDSRENAAIMTAAPDLYEALAEAEKKLRILAEVAEDVRLEGAPMIAECADRAAAALAKANPDIGRDRI